MTGAEHVEQAEHWLEEAKGFNSSGDETYPMYCIGIADVHATLALVQATLATGEYADWDAPQPTHQHQWLTDGRVFINVVDHSDRVLIYHCTTLGCTGTKTKKTSEVPT